MFSGPWNGDSNIGRKAASLARLSAMKRGSASASFGAIRATAAASFSMSPLARMEPPDSNTRWYIGSRRIRSISRSMSRPQAAKMSASTRGYRKKVGPMSKRKVPAALGAVMVAERPPTLACRSNTVTSAPARARSIAAARPPGPAPTIPIRRLKRAGLGGSRGSGWAGEHRASTDLTSSLRPGTAGAAAAEMGAVAALSPLVNAHCGRWADAEHHCGQTSCYPTLGWPGCTMRQAPGA